METSTIINIATLVVLLGTGIFIYQTFIEYKKLSYLSFYEIVQKHHTKEMTQLRKDVFSQIDQKVKQARDQKKPLQEIDDAFHSRVSELANYYESLGLFLQGGWEIFPNSAKHMMLEMLHNSTTKAWESIKDNFDIIYPNKRPRDWAGSFQWLYGKVTEYRKEKSLV